MSDRTSAFCTPSPLALPLTRRPRFSQLAALWLVSACALAGCKANKSQDDTESTKEGAEKATQAASAPTRPNPADDMAEVVEKAALELAEPMGGDPAAAGDGPPPNGVLGPQRAQKEAPLGSAPQLTLASNGSEPRISLGVGPVAEKQPGQIEIAVRTGPRAALPTVVFRLQAVTPKAAAASAAAVTASVDAAARAFSLDVVAAELGASQPGQIPESTAAAIKKLKGSRFVGSFKADALASSLRFERAKGAGEELDILLANTNDALTSVIAALPTEPVGKDATWMVSSRETFMGTDVVAYRLFRVEEVTAEGLVVNLDTKRYTAGGSLALPGIVDNEVLQFEATDEAQLRFVPGQRLPVEGQILQRLGAVLSSGGNQTPIQIESRSLFAFPAPAGAIDAKAIGTGVMSMKTPPIAP